MVLAVVHQRFEGNRSIVGQSTDVGPNRNVERWFGENSAIRTEFENGTVEYTPPWDGMTRGQDLTTQESTYSLSLLRNIEETTTAGAVESDEGTYYVVEGDEHAPEEEVEQTQQGFEVEDRTLVREDGLVRQTVSERVHVHSERERILVNQTLEITAIGETTVERLDWYEEAVVAGSGEERVSTESGGDEASAGDAEETDGTEDDE